MKGLQRGRNRLQLWGKLYLYFYFDSFHENIPKWITRRILACLFFSWKLFLITGCLWTMYMTMFPIATKIKINYSSVWKVFFTLSSVSTDIFQGMKNSILRVLLLLYFFFFQNVQNIISLFSDFHWCYWQVTF